MSDLDEVQPIDHYVRRLLESVKEKRGIDIDLDNPTRGQRLEAALAMQHEADGFYSMEIMVGRRVDSSEPAADNFAFLRIAEAMNPSRNPRAFYEGFAHLYWPNKERDLQQD